MADSFVRSQTTIATYSRRRELKNDRTGCKLFVQYRPQCNWLAHYKFTFVADDQRGLRVDEIYPVIGICLNYSLLLAEVAFDFAPNSGVDLRFVKRYGRFGKSWLRPDKGGLGHLRFGSRKSDKLVRCYMKESTNSFRVEIEFHSRIIREYGIKLVEDLPTLSLIVIPDHLFFVRINWDSLREFLDRKFGEIGEVIYQTARKHAAASLNRVFLFLKARGVLNIHRFLVSLPVNAEARRALRNWRRRFRRESPWETAIECNSG